MTPPSSAQKRAPSAAFILDDPAELSSGVVFSSPHSGRSYFPEFLTASKLSGKAIRASEDAFVDDLFRQARMFGAPMISAVAPRAYVDLNRAPTEMDPLLVRGADPATANARVMAGLGVVPRIVAEGVEIYHKQIRLDEAQQRVELWHKPYHTELKKLLLRARTLFGEALLIDCHSMPSGVTQRHGRRPRRYDVVLGDRFGAASKPEYIDALHAAFEGAGLRVGRNTPFAGGYITERYGRPAANVSAVQVELDRGLYLDEKNIAPHDGFETLRRTLTNIVSMSASLIRTPDQTYWPGAQGMAAE